MGNEFLVNTTTSGLQFQPAVVSLRDSNFMVVWADRSDSSIKGQRFRPSGAQSGGEFEVSTSTPEDSNTNRQWPTAGPAGLSEVAVWIEEPFNVPPPFPQVKLQRFLNGQKAGPEIQVSTTDIDPENRPSVTNMIDGGFVVTWADSRQDQRIRAQRFNDEGSKAGPEFTANVTEGFHRRPVATVLDDGRYVIAWTDDPSGVEGGRLTFRVFDLDGSPQGDEIILTHVGGLFPGANSMTLLDNGGFVVASINATTLSGLGVQQSTVVANIFEADGTERTSVSVGPPRDFNRSWPAVAPLTGGRFLLSWVEKSATTVDTVPAVMAQVCSDSQGTLGEKVQVSTASIGDRFQVCAATAVDGSSEHAFVTWADDSRGDGDTSDFAVRGRAFRIDFPGSLV
ncbi:hypothetical protein [Streptomyces sp. NPDC054838]